GVGDAAVEVDAVRGGVPDPQAAEGEAVHWAVHPGADLHVLDPQIRGRGTAHRAADAVDLAAVAAFLHVAGDGEVLQVHVRARIRRGVAVEAGRGAGDGRVPHARAGDRHVIDADVARDVVRARRDPHGAARTGCADRRVERGGRVVTAAGVGAVAGHRDRAGGLGERGADVLEVREVDRVGGGAVLGVDLESKGGAGRIRRAEQPVRLVVEVVRIAAGGVGERVAAVVPAVGVGEGEVALLGAVDVERERRGVDGPARGVRDRIPEVD